VWRRRLRLQGKRNGLTGWSGSGELDRYGEEGRGGLSNPRWIPTLLYSQIRSWPSSVAILSRGRSKGASESGLLRTGERGSAFEVLS
jgi:hypothetical protein